MVALKKLELHYGFGIGRSACGGEEGILNPPLLLLLGYVVGPRAALDEGRDAEGGIFHHTLSHFEPKCIRRKSARQDAWRHSWR